MSCIPTVVRRFLIVLDGRELIAYSRERILTSLAFKRFESPIDELNWLKPTPGGGTVLPFESFWSSVSQVFIRSEEGVVISIMLWVSAIHLNDCPRKLWVYGSVVR